MLAHITKFNNKRINQTVREHSMDTAEYAGDVLNVIGLYNTAYLAGLLNDMG